MSSRNLSVTALPAFTDNYLWMIHDGRNAAVVDPGDAEVVTAWLQENELTLTAILLTHHHSDHIGGVDVLRRRYPKISVIGHGLDAHRLPALDRPVGDGDDVAVPGVDLQIQVIATPGHTLGHVCYFSGGWLFCGDTLFSAGCGRMFEGSAEQFHASLSRLAALPATTQIFAAHEYTLGNLAFAASIEPQDRDIEAALCEVRQHRVDGRHTLPSTMGWELRHNPFLRCHDPAIAGWAALSPQQPVAVFAALRRAKDSFRAR